MFGKNQTKMTNTLRADVCTFVTSVVVDVTIVFHFMNVAAVSVVAMITNISSRRNVGPRQKSWTDQHSRRWSKPVWFVPSCCCC